MPILALERQFSALPQCTEKQRELAMYIGNFMLLVASAEHSLDKLIHRVLDERPTFKSGRQLLSNQALGGQMPVGWEMKSRLFLDLVDELKADRADLPWLADFERHQFEAICENVYNCRNFLAHGDTRLILGSQSYILFTEKFRFKGRKIEPEKAKFKSDFFSKFLANAEHMRTIYLSFSDAIFDEDHMVSQVNEMRVQYTYG